jgi:hypothetical protein
MVGTLHRPGRNMGGNRKDMGKADCSEANRYSTIISLCREDVMIQCRVGNPHTSFLGNIQESDVYDPLTGKRAKNGQLCEIAM